MDGQLVSPAAQAGTSAVRDSLVSLGARFLYLYDYPDAPMRLDRVADFIAAAGAVRTLAHARMGMMGYADMGLYSIMFDGLDVRSRLGVEVEFIRHARDRAGHGAPDGRPRRSVRSPTGSASGRSSSRCRTPCWTAWRG